LGVLLFVLGCRQVAAPAGIGQSSFRFIERPEAEVSKATNVTVVEPKIGEFYRDATPVLPLVMPIYPPRALAAKVGLTVIGVRVTVNKEGRVTDVGPSLVAVSILTKFGAEFQEAVRAAVSRWRFSPAEMYHAELVTPPGGEPYRRIVDQENVDASFDLAFTFTATGEVRNAMPGR